MIKNHVACVGEKVGIKNVLLTPTRRQLRKDMAEIGA